MAENAQVKLQVELNATDNASSKAREAGGAFRELGGQLQEVGKIAAGFTLGNLGASVGMGLAEHFKSALTEAENFGNQVYQLQQRLGLSSQSASGILSVFERFGVSSDEANKSLDFFSRGLRNNIDATEGGIEAAGQFQGTLAELGVSAVDAQGHLRPVDEVLADVIDRMHAVSGDGQTAARAITLFSRSGADLAPILNLSKQEFIDFEAEAQRLGVTLSQQNVDAIRQLSIAQHDLDETTRGLTIQFGLAFVPTLRNAATAVAKYLQELDKSSSSGQGLKDLATAVSGAGGAVGSFTEPFMKFLVQLADPNTQAGMKLAMVLLGPGPATGPVGQIFDASGTGPTPTEPAIAGQSDLAKQTGFPLLGPNGERQQAHDIALAQQQASPFAHIQDLKESGPRLAFSYDPSGPSASALAHIQDLKESGPRPLSNAEKLKQLNIGELAANREQELLQQQLNVLNRDDLDLVNQRAQAELAMLPIKQQQADLEVQLLETSKQRQQIDRESALQAAQLAAMPASAALEENQYQQQLIQAQAKASIASGHGIPAGALRDLMGLERAAPELEVNSLVAGHDVTLAQQAQRTGSLQQQRDTADIRKQQADLAIGAAQKQRDLDAVNAELQRQQLEKVPAQSGLEQQRRNLEDNIFTIKQQQNQLSGGNAAVNVQLTVNEASQTDYSQLLKDLGGVVLGAMLKATGRTEAPAPAFAPGAVG